MRIKRIVGRSTLPKKARTRSTARSTTVQSSESSSNIRALPSSRKPIAIPPATRPLHPTAFRFELGLAKYTSGLISAPKHLGRALNVENAAFKIYSQRPISLRESQLLQRAAFSIDRSPPSNSVRDILGEMWQVMVRPFQMIDGVENVYFQVFRDGRRITPLELLQTIVTGRERQWSLIFNQHRRPHCGSSASRPSVTLVIPDFRILKWCKYSGGARTVFWPSLRFTIFGHLRPFLTRREQDRTQTGGGKDVGKRDGLMQSIVDEVHEHAAQSVFQKVFREPNEMLSTIKGKVFSYLASSPLAAAIDLHHLEIVFYDRRSGKRYALSTLLNADGTENSGTTGRISAAPASNQDVHEGEGLVHKLKVATTSQRFSDMTAKKLGFQLNRLTANCKVQGARRPAAPSVLTIFDTFDSLCRSSDDVGLVCCSIASSRLGEEFPELSITMESIQFPVKISPTRLIAAPFIQGKIWLFSNIPIYEAHNCDLSVQFHKITDVTVQLSGSHAESGRIQTLSIDLQGKHDRHSSQSGHQIPTGAELEALAQMTITVLDKLCEEKLFDSREAIPSLFAEACLRTIRFLSNNIYLRQVHVAAKMSDPLSGTYEYFRGTASRTHLNSDSTAATEVRSSLSRVVQGVPEAISDSHGVQVGDIEESHAAFATDRPPDREESILNGEDIDEAEVAQQDSPPDGHAGDPEPKTKYPHLNEATESLARITVNETKTVEKFPDIDNILINASIPNHLTATTHRATASCSTHFANDSDRGIYIALGSNEGDRLERIEMACRAIDEDIDMSVMRTSALYETEPMYVEDQSRFLNGVCEIATKLQPLELLNRLQAIEQKLGRVKLIDKGPRNIDLDILLYRNESLKTDRLTIPHPLMLEREFVLRPLCDISSARKHPIFRPRRRYFEFLRDLPPQSQPMHTVTPLAATQKDLRPNDPGRLTQIMSILNVTPDSFSDGGVHQPADIKSLRATISAQIAAGASIIDIGGQSSRPNAAGISVDEELARVLPAIEAIKSLPEAVGVSISVDTYRAAVAEAAVRAGAHIINDISAGTLDEDMLPTVARLGCTYIMMHMRGTPATMQSDENCSYPDGLIPTIVRELWHRIQAAQDAGIFRWRIILDPGIGFAKTQEQNVELLTKLSELRQDDRLGPFPWLLGSSRKSFIGKITGVQEPRERMWGTAATVTAAVQGGADIVRVHDVGEMSDVVRMSDAMYRV